MPLHKFVFFCLSWLLFFVYSPSADAQVALRTEGLNLQTGATFRLSLYVDDLAGESVSSYQFTLRYDADLIRIDGIDAEGTLSEDLAPLVNVSGLGEVTVAAAGTVPLSGGSNTLIVLEGRVLGEDLVGEAVISPAFEELLLFDTDGSEVSYDLEVTPLRVAGLRVFIEPASGTADEAFSIAIQVGDLTGRSVTSYQFTLRYDPNIAIIEGANTQGTLTTGSPIVNATVPGRLVLAYAGATPLAGTGELIRLTGSWQAPGDPKFTFDEIKLFDTLGDEVPITSPEFVVQTPVIADNVGSVQLLPIRTGNLTGLGITAYQFSLEYDPSILAIDGIDTEGTISSGLIVTANNGTPGITQVTLAVTTPLDGEGPLVNLVATRLSAGDPQLRFTNYRLFSTGNESVPLTISPNKGGDTGSVTATISGLAFSDGATVQLVQGGTFIDGESVTGVGDVVTANFNLVGHPQGFYDLVVTSDGITGTLPEAFEVVEGEPAFVWVDVIGRDAIRLGREQTYTIMYGNRGNTDALMVPLSVFFPQDVEYRLDFEILELPDTGAEPLVDPSLLPDTLHAAGRALLPLFLPVVKSGQTGSIDITITSQNAGSFELTAWAGTPLLIETETGLNASKDAITALQAETIGCALSSLGLSLAAASLAISPELCAVGIGLAIAGIGTTVVDAVRSRPPGASANPALLGVGYTAGMLGLTVSIAGIGACVVANFPAVKLATYVLAGIGAAVGLLGVLGSCDIGGYGNRVVDVVGSFDPNEKVGSQGFGDTNFLSGEDPLRYAIYFENLPAATAAAQEVFITDTLDTEVIDLSTFSFGPIHWGRTGRVIPPPGLKRYATQVDLRPALDLLLAIDATLSIPSGVVKWTFRSLDPATGLLTDDPFAGFLPPNVNAPEGEGRVLFTVAPKPTLVTNTSIENRARIVFDLNAPIDTNTWINTIDNTKPTSQVLTAEATGVDSIKVSWAGLDEGAGIQGYSIYTSINGGPFLPWLANTPNTTDYFVPDTSGVVAFYSVARDGSGNLEEIPLTPDVSTVVSVAYEENDWVVPSTFSLKPNYPNPFSSSTTIRYDLPSSEHVRLEIFDALGRSIAVLVDAVQPAGSHAQRWVPEGLASGLYFYRLEAGDAQATRSLFYK